MAVALATSQLVPLQVIAADGSVAGMVMVDDGEGMHVLDGGCSPDSSSTELNK